MADKKKLNREILLTLNKAKLLGVEAHAKVMSYKRESVEQGLKRTPAPKESAVLCLLYELKSDWHLVLMKRNVYEGTHSGQISLPGGKKEAKDKNLLETALRECEEEIGVSKNQLEILTPLTSLFIPPSNFIVQPFVAIANNPISFTPDPREVDLLLQMPLDFLTNENSLIDTKVKLSGTNNHIIKVKAFDFENEIIWGATAMILVELAVMIRNL
ncbi:MAG: 8-oxo-dGTP pyrophosphatase MutT (NUDIX family) [Patiriisocius sp.]|jgi:8-oxo-dGTP pyrophosphatase MutT (NUDIX family)